MEQKMVHEVESCYLNTTCLPSKDPLSNSVYRDHIIYPIPAREQTIPREPPLLTSHGLEGSLKSLEAKNLYIPASPVSFPAIRSRFSNPTQVKVTGLATKLGIGRELLEPGPERWVGSSFDVNFSGAHPTGRLKIILGGRKSQAVT